MQELQDQTLEEFLAELRTRVRVTGATWHVGGELTPEEWALFAPRPRRLVQARAG
jgi:hypothetical protein